MPPKAAKGPPPIDGINTTNMTREQIETYAINIKAQNDKEREERNFFQLERDKLRTFWEITRNELEEARAKLRNKDQQIEEADKKNSEQLKVYKQKIKFLQYEYQNDVTQCKAEGLISMKNATDDHIQQEAELLTDKKQLKKHVKDQETCNQDQIKDLKTEHSRLLYEARKEYENKARELELKYDKKFTLLKQELDTKHKMEMAEVEERKNSQINELTKYHEINFNEMKNYYNDITLNNLALISSLKEQMEILQKQNDRMAKQVADLSSENRKLQEPLKIALADVVEYKRQLQNYEKDKIALANTLTKLRDTKKELDNMVWRDSALELRFDKLQAEKDELQKRFTVAVLEVQQKSALKNQMLQKRIEILNNQGEVKEGVISVLHKQVSFPVNFVYKKLDVCYYSLFLIGGIIDGVDTSQMSREQLEIFCHRIREESEREREERNFFQIERDKLRNFWEITKTELEEVKAKLRNKDRLVEEVDEKNEEEIKFHKQQVKHLKYEHQNNLTECKAEATVALKLAQDKFVAQERELVDDKMRLKKQLREQEVSFQDLIKALKLKHSEDLSKVKKQFETRAKEIERKYSKKYFTIMEELEVKRRMEVSEIEERKNCQISTLINDHEKVFTEMKNYYNDITLNNLALISSLKDQILVFKKQSDDATKAAATMTVDNRKLTKPLQKAENELKECKKQLENYKQDKLTFTNTRAKFHDLKKEFDNLRWSNEVLQLQFEKLQSERDQLRQKFMQAVLEIQQKTTLKNAHLQKRLQFLSDVADYRETVIEELTSSSEIPPHYKKFEEVLSNKNLVIKNLQDELSKMCQAYNELLEMYREKFDDFGEPIQATTFVLKEIMDGDGEDEQD
ncbi:hypothetical protein RN001_004479 [Aquatica leii]|uniref:Dynein regulatory complex subunit 4 n=1 Tax=Aquatica leii TaxID=1421715 RepID=A0AAN7SRQ6_9COLE|nr:hypothetical protein RN001_004479 [Aquatica leii]